MTYVNQCLAVCGKVGVVCKGACPYQGHQSSTKKPSQPKRAKTEKDDGRADSGEGPEEVPSIENNEEDTIDVKDIEEGVDEADDENGTKGCHCPKKLDLVCGIDGHTYHNPCQAKCEDV